MRGRRDTQTNESEIARCSAVRAAGLRRISHVPQQQMIGGVLASGHFGRCGGPKVLVPVAAGYEQQFSGRAHFPLVQRLPAQFREALRQMADQRQEAHVARMTVRHACKTPFENN